MIFACIHSNQVLPKRVHGWGWIALPLSCIHKVQEQQDLAVIHLGWSIRAFSQSWEGGVRKSPPLSIISVFHSYFQGEWVQKSKIKSAWMYVFKASIQKFSSRHLCSLKQFKQIVFLVPLNKVYIYTVKRYQFQFRVFSWWWKIFSLAQYQDLLSWWLSWKGLANPST